MKLKKDYYTLAYLLSILYYAMNLITPISFMDIVSLSLVSIIPALILGTLIHFIIWILKTATALGFFLILGLILFIPLAFLVIFYSIFLN